jgi:hypothetical protein
MECTTTCEKNETGVLTDKDGVMERWVGGAVEYWINEVLNSRSEGVLKCLEAKDCFVFHSPRVTYPLNDSTHLTT